MKRSIFIIAGGLLVVILSCCQKESKVNEIPDAIVYSEINKTLINIKKDSVVLSCSYVLFEIYKNPHAGTPDSLSVRITRNSLNILGDCGNSFLNKSDMGYPAALDENTVISDIGIWGSNNGQYNLSDFMGKGEKYLGMMTQSILNNMNSMRYAWIRIYCSSGNDTLKIIDWAYNNVAYKSIKAGQMQ
jgi:hypothetical protein